MFSIPFLSKKDKKQGYTFVLFLAGEKAYGFAFEKARPDNKSTLYSEPIDPFLKDAVLKIEKIITSCEHELGEEVYLQQTILFLNSLYITESGSIREDFLQNIKKLLKDLDLENLGYVNFFEAVNVTYGALKEHYQLLEESVYDYTIYDFEHAKLTHTEKVAKTQDEEANNEELKKNLKKGVEVVSFLYRFPTGQTIKIQEHIGEKELINLFHKLYVENMQEDHSVSPALPVTPVEVVPEKVEAGEELKPEEKVKEEPVDLPDQSTENVSQEFAFKEAPGFITKNFGEQSGDMQNTPETKRPTPQFITNIKNFRFPKGKAWIALPAVVLLIVLAFVYANVIYSAKIVLHTKKENFSTTTAFDVGRQKGIGKEFTNSLNIKTSQSTTGEKVLGEVAKGTASIYNGFFEKKSLPANTKLKTKSGIVFTLEDAVTVPSATTSANLGAGVVTKAFGKIDVGVEASALGPDGNINSSTKLLVDTYDEADLYGLAAKNFTGGFKRTIQTFSEDDRTDLEKKALALATKEMQTKFNSSHTNGEYLFPDTLSITQKKTNYSAKVNEEVGSATLQLQGNGSLLFLTKDDLSKKVQNDKLKDKEFVKGTFEIKKLTLKTEHSDYYTYEALVLGKVQKLIDEERLKTEIASKVASAARSTLDAEHTVDSYTIELKPFPLPFMPLNPKNIQFEFSN